MTATTFVVEQASSRLTVRTRATGMLAKLAHDLDIAASSFSGKVALDGESFSAELTVAVSGLSVVGTLHGDKVDASVLSPSDRAEIAQKIRNEVLVGAKDVRVTARGNSRDHGEVLVEIGSGRLSVPVSIQVTDQGGLTHASGRVELSMKKLGLREVKGPLNAFRVSDVVEVLFELTLRPES